MREKSLSRIRNRVNPLLPALNSKDEIDGPAPTLYKAFMRVVCLDVSGSHLADVEFTRLDDEWVRIESLTRLEVSHCADFERLPALHEGFFDSHLHPTWMAALKLQIDCRNKSAEELASAISTRPEETLYGYGWSEESHARELSNVARYFDEILPQNKKLFLYRVCGHSAYLSRAAKAALGFNHDGLLMDRELQKIPDFICPPEELAKNFAGLIRDLRRAGISGGADLLVKRADFESLRASDALQPNDFDLQIFGDAKEFCRDPLVANPRPPYVKFFLDGSLGARTAWLSAPYDDDPKKTAGLQLWKNDSLLALATEALSKGYLLAFHAIGDGAIDQALWLGEKLEAPLKKALEAHADAKLFHRLEHLQVCRDDQIEKLARQNIWTLGLQPSHRTFDETFAAKRLGATRFESNAYRLRSFLTANLRVTLGSDAPVVPFDPQHCLAAAAGDPRATERITRGDAYRLHCVFGRQNAGSAAKKLAADSVAWLSKNS